MLLKVLFKFVFKMSRVFLNQSEKEGESGARKHKFEDFIGNNDSYEGGKPDVFKANQSEKKIR